MPLPRFNIEENINNIFKFNLSGTDIIINIPTGKYLIEDIINYVNNIINTKNIKLSINNEQKLILESSNINDILTIYPTHLSKNNFGFKDEYNNTNKIIASQTWDLRINDKIYLYLNNLSEDIPFGILFYNGQSVCQFKFDDYINLDKIEIIFKDSYNNNINFYNLSHNLNFLIEKI